MAVPSLQLAGGSGRDARRSSAHRPPKGTRRSPPTSPSRPAWLARMVLGTMLARLGKGLDSLADMATKRLGLPDESSDVLRGMIDQLRQSMVTDLKTLLAKPASLSGTAAK